jgi:hypothetical protein
MSRRYNDSDLAEGFNPEDVGPTVPPGTPRNPRIEAILRANSDRIMAEHSRSSQFLNGHSDAHRS